MTDDYEVHFVKADANTIEKVRDESRKAGLFRSPVDGDSIRAGDLVVLRLVHGKTNIDSVVVELTDVENGPHVGLTGGYSFASFVLNVCTDCDDGEPVEFDGEPFQPESRFVTVCCNKDFPVYED